MQPNPVQFDLTQIGAWLVIAVAAVAIVFVVLKVVSKVVSTSVRLAIIAGSLLVIALALLALSALLKDRGLPIL